MRVTVLGGSAAAPGPGAGCSGYLIEESGTRLVLDLGPGTLTELRLHADYRLLDGIVISHMHLDHMLDLLALRHALAYDPIRPAKRIPVWLPPDGAALLNRATAPFDACDRPGRFSDTVLVQEYEPEHVLSIGGFRLRFAPTVHNIPCWAMVVENGDGRRIGYSADTGPSANLAPFFSSADLLMCEATLVSPAAEPSNRGSLTAEEAGALAYEARAGALLLTHLWHETDGTEALRRAASRYAGPITIARPGLALEVA